MLGDPSIAAFVAHHRSSLFDLRDPVALLRGKSKTSSRILALCLRSAGKSRRSQPTLRSRSQAFALLRLDGAVAGLVAEDILDAYPARTARLPWLDVGGGEGGSSARWLLHAPQIERSGCSTCRTLRNEPARNPRGARLEFARRTSFPAASSTIRCQRAPISFRSCVSCTITTTNAAGAAARPHMRPLPSGRCRSAWPSRWRKPGRRADRRRLFRLLSARHGPRPHPSSADEIRRRFSQRPDSARCAHLKTTSSAARQCRGRAADCKILLDGYKCRLRLTLVQARKSPGEGRAY